MVLKRPHLQFKTAKTSKDIAWNIDNRILTNGGVTVADATSVLLDLRNTIDGLVTKGVNVLNPREEVAPLGVSSRKQESPGFFNGWFGQTATPATTSHRDLLGSLESSIVKKDKEIVALRKDLETVKNERLTKEAEVQSIKIQGKIDSANLRAKDEEIARVKKDRDMFAAAAKEMEKKSESPSAKATEGKPIRR